MLLPALGFFTVALLTWGVGLLLTWRERRNAHATVCERCDGEIVVTFWSNGDGTVDCEIEHPSDRFAYNGTGNTHEEAFVDAVREWATPESKADRERQALGPLSIEFDREKDGRWIAEIPELPGVLVYGATKWEAINKVSDLAAKVLEQQAKAEAPVATP